MAALVLVAQPGCGTVTEVCTLESRYAIAVTVVDSATGIGLGTGTTLTIQDGEYRDVVTRPAEPSLDGTPIVAGRNRPGTYDLLVERNGYAKWQRSNVRASSGPCGVKTTEVHARLQTLGS